MSTLDAIAADLPREPGVYLFKDRRGAVLYVGKATSLRARVRQYLSGHDDRRMVPFLLRRAVGVDVIVTRTEKEALLLENTLIKQHRPRFNVKLRDDANFLHLRLDLDEPWPRYRLVRRIVDDGARYFGPFTSASKARQTLEYLGRLFPLRTCSDATLRSRKRPCLLHQMGRCVAPCVDAVSAEVYQSIARDSTALLEGRLGQVVDDLESRMRRAAEAEAFEEAARWRDLLRSVQATVERQQVVDPSLADRDVWGLHRDGGAVALCVLPMRGGAVGEPSEQILDAGVESDGELLSSALNTWYQEGVPIPDEIFLPDLPTDHQAIEDLLSDRRGRRVRLHVPKRGDKTRLVEIARRNAEVRLSQQTDEGARRRQALASLAEVLGLVEPPERMECFDNSHLGGADPVAAMAVFVGGAPSRSDYRRFRIRTASGDDDYAGMREVLTRRFRRGLREGGLPDLVVIDGGRGQVGVACAVLEDVGLERIPVVGVAKARRGGGRVDRSRGAVDRLVLPHLKEPLRLPGHHPGLRMLMHLRDETHEHAVRYQRRTRRKAKLSSVLEELPGVGPARRRALLRSLGSVRGVLAATVEELAAVEGFGPRRARALYEALHGEESAETPDQARTGR